LKISLRIFFGCILLAGLFSKDAWAVPSPPPLPAGQDLEAQAERFQQEYSTEKREQEEQLKKLTIQVEEEKEKKVPPGPVFILKGINVTGSTIFNPSQLAFVWKPYLGKKVDLRSINHIVAMVKRVYTDLGYLTTTAYLPPQDVSNGVVEIRVVEGKRGNLTVEGNKYFSTPSIEKYFHTYRGETMDMGEVQKDLMRLNSNQDLSVISVLSPGEEPETVDVTLKATENLPYHVSVGEDNQGSRLTGTYRTLFTVDDSNLTGNHDNLSINTVITELSSGESASYQTPVGTNGAKMGLDAGYFEATLGKEYRSYDIINKTTFFTPNASWELYQSQDMQADLTSGVRIKDIKKTQMGTKITDEDLSIPYVGLNLIKSDSMGQTAFDPELSFGTPDFLGSSTGDNPSASRLHADRFFAKYSQYVSRTQKMPFDSYLQIISQFQYASHTLPTAEQFQLGGEGSVRGFPQGDYLADIGGDMDTEWYFPMYPIPASWTLFHSDVNLRHQIEPFIFYDLGGGKLVETYSGETKGEFLQGLGTGIKIHLKNNFYLKMEWGIPVGGTKPIHGTGPSTFDVSVQAGT